MRIYDLIIIGAGPAGISAGIYAKNFGLDCLIIGENVGGLINGAYKIENYPGIFDVTGAELMKKFKAHQEHLEITMKNESVEEINKKKDNFEIISEDNKYSAKAIILAIGTKARKLEIKNIDKFEDKGVYYQSGNNAFLYRNKIVAVIGGANAAVMSACMLAGKARKVYLIYRQKRLRADAIWVNKIKKFKNIEVIYNTNVVEIRGNLPAGRHGKKLERIVLDNGQILKVSGLLIGAGSVPDTYLIHNLGIKTDEKGYIEVDKSQATNIEGVFAAGDITTNSNEFRQIITACAEGAIAVLGVFNFLNKK